MPLLARLGSWFVETPPVPVEIDDARAPGATDPEAEFEALRVAIAGVRKELLEHPVYRAVDTLDHLRHFMEVHVYAVWDFMCLAKRLQRELTSLQPLWRPPRYPALARFINGVILGEESDTDPDGEAVSHCELYLHAMDEVGADTDGIRKFLHLIDQGADVDVALAAAAAPRAARTFVRHTLGCALEDEPAAVLASFVFGREDLIPEMFSRLLPRWRTSKNARKFTYYVERHIELDGDDHGPAARKALLQLCGQDPAAWAAARRAAEEAITARIALWDRVHSELT
ncbi:MAG TPA: DUF3050 domain-containing protein [Kofleriaceae bacterium]|jgi:hypothetical protein|nr:DUF3050 domain-containing protein [Kofleriaceae bacterium]